MPYFSHTEVVEATPEAIFAILDAVERTPEWLGRCTRLDRVTPGATAVGTKLVYHYKDGGRTGKMNGEVVTRTPNRKLTNAFSDKMMDVTVDFDLAPSINEGTTNLTHTITITPKGFGMVFGPIIKRQLPGQTLGAMEALKALAERG